MPLTHLAAIFVDRDSRTPVFVQICQSIREQIRSGQLDPETRLAPSRSLAVELGVSRTTIISAYDQLIAEGYIEGRRGSGVYVSANAHVELVPSTSKKRNPNKSDIDKQAVKKQPTPSSPDLRLFPYKKWAQYVSRTARLSPKSLIIGGEPFGDLNLRNAIAGYLAEWRGINVSPAQIMITAGSGDALECCIRTLLVRGSVIGLEDPGYLPLRNFVKREGLRPCWLNIEHDGTTLPNSKARGICPELIVLTPSHQYPLGGTMSPGRRTEFLNWSDQTGGWLVEDDYDSEFRYAGRPIPAMAGFDESGRTLYVGSFSKIFSESMRLGFLVSPTILIDEFKRTLSVFGLKASLGSQPALAGFMNDGEFYRHIRRVRRVYGERRQRFLDYLRTELSQLITYDDHQAGMQLAIKLPAKIDDILLAKSIKKRGGIANALSLHYTKRNQQSGLLLGFCSLTVEEMTANLKIIKNEIQKRLI